MMNYFVFNGRDSRDFNTYLAASNMFDAPARDIESMSIPGRNGNIIFDNGRFSNFAGSLSAYIPKGMQSMTGQLRAALMSVTSYARYEDTMHPGEYRLARYGGAFEIEDSDRVGAAFTLSFDCKPQRFLVSGERPISVSNGSVLYNPTSFDALPLIVCTGNGTITFGGKTLTVSGNAGQIYIDCEGQNAFLGSTNKNSFVTPTFPALNPGANTISISGLSNVSIIPRWWTI